MFKKIKSKSNSNFNSKLSFFKKSQIGSVALWVLAGVIVLTVIIFIIWQFKDPVDSGGAGIVDALKYGASNLFTGLIN
ncbi:hypothetical protein HOK51_10125 [Candidatus Woesearchaeota archaeon]|jgi:hypothetical protein|nr:hypothetical protein [Candidatus Woesearchaeota archaeon]MBT6520181.1 hypothetical protein [Candidatus Woesearchaeota archaeon]MBT7367193.1 hypothetical protein [Candidatus Woesearchaeota archaeon]